MDDRRARAEAIEEFAGTLRELRESAGNPSFREMSGRSGAISHTTLHEATKGNRLPSWETTVEFARACGADPDAYRERWERASRTVRTGNAADPSPRADTPADQPSEGLAVSTTGTAERRTAHLVLEPQTPRPADETLVLTPSPSGEPTDDAPPTPPVPGGPLAPSGPPVPGGGSPGRNGRRKRRGLTRPAVAVLATAAVGAVAVVAGIVADRGGGSGERGAGPAGGPSVAALTPADCPVAPKNPAAAPPAHEGDAAQFVADRTLPDCTPVGSGRTVTKVWRLKNVGTVPWKGYGLRLLDSPQRADQCQTISHVPIEDTPPGEFVDIRVEVTTPREPGFCYVRFKMVDASGEVAFPGNRPVNFQIIVV